MSHISEHCCTSDTFWVYILAVVCLLLFAGLMSGLTLGLMSLSLTDLEVIKESGSPKDRMHAAKIIPVVRRQHLLLVTLLVGNALAMEALPLFLDSMVSTWMAILISVTMLLMFGEILPQAICSQYGLAVGATMTPVVRVLLVVMFPVAWPVSKLLDKILGKKHNDLFCRAELITLVNMHCNEAGKGGELSTRETTLITRTLELAAKTAADAMTLLEFVVSVDSQSRIDEGIRKRVVASGHSRIPVYSGKPNNITGLILVKNLLNVTVDQHPSNLPIVDLPIKQVQRFPADMPLHDVLHHFCHHRTHMAVVVRYTEYHAAESDQLHEANATIEQGRNEEIVGIITREDVLEELLKESLHLKNPDSKVVIVNEQEFPKVSTVKFPNGEAPLSETSLFSHSPKEGHQLALKFPSMDDADLPSVSNLLSSASATLVAPMNDHSSNISSFVPESAPFHPYLPFPPRTPKTLPAANGRVEPEQSGQTVPEKQSNSTSNGVNSLDQSFSFSSYSAWSGIPNGQASSWL